MARVVTRVYHMKRTIEKKAERIAQAAIDAINKACVTLNEVMGEMKEVIGRELDRMSQECRLAAMRLVTTETVEAGDGRMETSFYDFFGHLDVFYSNGRLRDVKAYL